MAHNPREYVAGPAGTPDMVELLRKRMTALGIDTRELAEKIGKSRSYTHHIVTGAKPVTKEETIATLAEAIGVRPDAIYAAQGMIPHDLARAISRLDEEDIATLRSRLAALAEPASARAGAGSVGG